MFNNISTKIKISATVLFWIGTIVFSVLGIAYMFAESFSQGLLILIVGVLSCLIGSYVIYGFGQLIENTDRIVSKLDTNCIDKHLKN